MANPTKSDVVKAWSALGSKQDQYDVREIETTTGLKQVQLIDKDTGSVSVAVNGSGADAYKKLIDHVGETIDAAELPKESVSQDNELQFTSRGNLATPTQPEAVNDAAEQVVVNENNPIPENSNDVPTHRDPSTGGTGAGSRDGVSGSTPTAPSTPANAPEIPETKKVGE